MSYPLLKEIISSVWAIEPTYASALIPYADKILAGKEIDMSEEVSAESMTMVESNDSDQNILMITIDGVIRKHNYCGEQGLLSIEKSIKQASNDPSIGAIILDIDSGGGAATHLNAFVDSMRACSKPIIGMVSDISASAAYYIGSNCDYLFCQNKMNRVGSIGTLISFTENKNSDYKQHVIYATKSIDKNKGFEEALKGNYEVIISEMLDPFNEQFHADVKEGRPDISEEVFTGKMYFANQAEELGMHDGIKNKEEVIEFTNTHMKTPSFFTRLKNKQKSNPEQMGKIAKIIGRTPTEDKPITAAELVMIEQNLSNPTPKGEETPKPKKEEEPEAPKALTAEDVTKAVSAGIAPVTTQLTQMADRMSAVEKELELDAAAPADAGQGGANDDPVQLDPWEDPNNPLNKAVNANLDNM